MSCVLILLHGPSEPLGALAPPLAAAGLATDTRLSPEASLPPNLEGYGGIVVMGGVMGVYEAHQHPFLAEEIRLLREALDHDVPALGVCLGSQLLAAAGGARVYRGEAGPEVGWLPVKRLAGDPWLRGWPLSFSPLNWHGDTFDLPPGARHLASSERYPHQGFRLGSGLGLQFHVEATAEMAREWLGGPAVPLEGRPAPEHLARSDEAAARMAPLVASLGAAFAEAVLAVPPGRWHPGS